jgi:hypothetical protein
MQIQGLIHGHVASSASTSVALYGGCNGSPRLPCLESVRTWSDNEESFSAISTTETPYADPMNTTELSPTKIAVDQGRKISFRPCCS